MTIYIDYPSPIGQLYLISNGHALVGCYFENAWSSKSDESKEGRDDVLDLVVSQLDEYFNKKRKMFNLPIELNGTEFQKAVWKSLLQIPYGETCSYQKQAESIGNVKAVRAVGSTNGKNPISIIIPCHRVIGKNGSLTGYAGGMENKKHLLALESC